MNRTITCVMCPNGCEITVTYEGKKLLFMEGAQCRKGDGYVRQEITDPRRNIASSVRVLNGTHPLVSVRLTEPIPRDRIMSVMAIIRDVRLEAPVAAGRIILQNVLSLGSDVIATKGIDRIQPAEEIDLQSSETSTDQ